MKKCSARLLAKPGMRYLAALLLGTLLPLAFAPYDIFPFAVLAPMGLLALLLGTSSRQGFYLGLTFGLGYFGAGVYWVYHSIHVFGGVPPSVSALITALLVLFLALFPAITCYLTQRYFNTLENKLIYAFPAIWVLLEWVRSWLFTGFPWLLLGYSQTHSPLKGFAPIFSVYGVSLAILLTSSLLVYALLKLRQQDYRTAYLNLLACVGIWTLGALLSLIPWTEATSNPLSVSLVQGNIPQHMKWAPEHVQLSLDRYETLTAPLWKKDQIIIWPEAAVPMSIQNAASYINMLDAKAKDTGATLILGIPAEANDGVSYYNSIVTLGAVNKSYVKRRLVPFGEYIPLKKFSASFFNFMHIPFPTLISGSNDQAHFSLNGAVFIPSICYEIAFPELNNTMDDKAGVLLTLTNDAWFGDSSAQAQHLQMAAMRAIELGRPAIFVSNDGITALIDANGNVLKALPPRETAVLNGTVQPMHGLTPWMRNGMDPILFIALVMLGKAILANILAARALRKQTTIQPKKILSDSEHTMEEQYKPQEIEADAQEYWHEKNSFHVIEDVNKEKFYCLSMMPYPSGTLHMGHVRNYTIGDVIARYQYMMGKNVLQPMCWDAFGLPAENAAIKHKVPPAQWTRQNIDHMRKQFMRMGFAYDWSREITTCDPDYYRFEQWFFLRLYQKGLVYKKNSEVNWDPIDQTVLANEQVIDGRGWRSGALVERREIPQWFLKITAYSAELLADIDKLTHWPEQVRTMQRNWIGRSEGLELQFAVPKHDALTVFTTRPDTLFGVTYLAVAPQHPLAKAMSANNPALHTFIEECRNIKLAEADVATMEKRGVPLGIDAIHPLTGERVPVWAANFVLMEYGSGALMAVPAHDQRDFEFAVKYNLPIKQVITPANNETCDLTKAAFTDAGILINSADYNGLTSKDAFDAFATYFENKQLGTRKVNYRLRDWGVSRQRYWGAPIPIINCPHCGAVPVPEKDLPVVLPEDVEFTGVTSPLKSMPSFLNTTCPNCNEPATRETDTFDTFMDSSWYYARLACKKQNKTMLDGRANYWLPVDQYVGGIEHAVLHLLYARFFHKLMRDEGLLNSDEPFTRLLSQGMVLNDGVKMSKSKGNVVDPQPLVERYGADTVRLFMMFAAPPEQSLEWSDSGVEGAHRFLKRLWALAHEHKETVRIQNRLPKSNQLGSANWDKADPAQVDTFRQIYEILESAKYDYERQQFNTVVSSCMKILNLLVKLPPASSDYVNIHDIVLQQGLSILLRLLAPITPHITHRLWQDLNYEGIILDAPWPRPSAIVFKVDTVQLVVQVNGKLRGRIQVAPDAAKEVIEKAALVDSKVAPFITGKTVKKVIIVPGKLVNVVVSE